MWWKILLYLLMSGVIISAFVAPTPMDSGEINSKYHTEEQAEAIRDSANVYRIFYFHVPQAWIAALAFLISMYHSIRYLQTRDINYDIKAVSANSLGLMFAILATVTGSLFAKMTWGHFWNWGEIREVSVFILLLIYGAYFALRSALPNEESRATLSSVMSIMFAAAAIFLIFILPRIFGSEGSQHPSDTFESGDEGTIQMGVIVRYIFFSSLAAFTILFGWLYNLAVKIGMLENKNRWSQ